MQKSIYNKETKVADLINEELSIPSGWTEQSPKWIEFEIWDDENNCWGISLELKKKYENNFKIAEAKKYLSETDWYIIRFIERGIPGPEEVKAKRIEAIELINKLEQ
jgi:hypothetical protein